MPDTNHLILTAVGPDRVGLVEKIAEFIARHDCNIEDSKMAVFCGEFAVIVSDHRRRRQAGKDRPAIIAKSKVETGLTISIKTPAVAKPRNRSCPTSSQPHAWIIRGSFTRSATC